jgi:hypothetical protein
MACNGELLRHLIIIRYRVYRSRNGPWVPSGDYKMRFVGEAVANRQA